MVLPFLNSLAYCLIVLLMVASGNLYTSVRPASWACDLWYWTGPVIQWSLMSLGLHHCVEILDNIIFELVFVSDIQWDNEMCKWTETMLTLHVYPSSCCVICREHFWCLGAQDSYWSMIVGVQPGSEYKGKACYISIWVVRSLMGNHFFSYLSQIWFEHWRKAMVFKKSQWPRNPILSFHLYYSFISANRLVWKWWFRK